MESQRNPIVSKGYSSNILSMSANQVIDAFEHRLTAGGLGQLAERLAMAINAAEIGRLRSTMFRGFYGDSVSFVKEQFV
jgi:hypothetical protein